ncbi:MAG: hypothetical protein MK479_01545, partial [Planctomycetes bacterium]|nr:hypothetical protein [Planctomycetota bacterium]
RAGEPHDGGSLVPPVRPERAAMKTVFQGVLLFAALLIPLGVDAQMEPPMHSFLRADANTDGTVDLRDAVYTFGWLFLGADMPECLALCRFRRYQR